MVGVVVTLLGMVVSVWAQPVFAQTAKEAKAAIDQRNYDQAITQLRSLLTQKPRDEEAHYLLGLALKGKGQKEEAAAEFEAAIKENKKYTDALYELGMLQIDMKQLEAAGRTLMEGDKQTKGKDARFAYGMGLLKVAEGNLEEAKNFMTAATAAQPNNPVFQRGFGDVYTAMKVWPLAIGAYQKALSMEPNSPNAAFTHYQLGKLYFETRDFNKAVEEYRQALALDASLVDAYYQQGYILFLAKQYVSAVEPLQKAIEHGRNDEETNFMLAESLNHTQRIKMAVPYYQRTVVLNPNRVEAYAGLAEGLLALKEYTKAVEAYKKAVAQNPQDANLVYSLGWAQTQAEVGQYEEGIAHLQKAIALDPSSEKPHIQLALVYFDQQKFPEAIPHLQKAIELSPEDQNPYAYLGRAYVKQGQYAEAVTTVKGALEPVLQQQTDENKAKLSNVYFSLGQELYNESRSVTEKEARNGVLRCAVDLFRAKIVYDSTSHPAYLYMGLAGLVLNEGAMARDAFLRVLDLRKDEEDPKTLLQTKKFLATSYLILEDYGHAGKIYEELLQLNPQDDDAYFRLGQIGLMNKNYPRAIQHLRKAIEIKSDNAAYHLSLAQALTNAQQLQAAIKEYNETLRLEPNNATARQQLEQVRKAAEQLGGQ
jgi:tetratricopeptide (TPR) repeat protein